MNRLKFFAPKGAYVSKREINNNKEIKTYVVIHMVIGTLEENNRTGNGRAGGMPF